MFKKFLLLGLFLISFNAYSFSSEENNKPKIDDSKIITLHFVADNNVPFKFGEAFAAYDTFTELVLGLMTEPTNSYLPVFGGNVAVLSSADTGDDPSTIHLILKKNLYFDDGNTRWEATSDDLKFSISRFFFSNVKSNLKNILSNIDGVDKIQAGTAYNPNLIPSIKVINRYEISIQLKTIDPLFIEHIRHAGTPLVSIKTLESDYINWKTIPVGVGSYKVIYANNTTGETILEKRNDATEGNKIKYIRFISSKDNAGDLFWKDMWKLDPNQYKQQIMNVTYGTLVLFFNYDTKLGQNENFRNAISLAINRDELVKNQPYLRKNNEIIPLNIWGRAGIEQSQNIKLAKELLKKVPNEFTKEPITINIYGQNEEALAKSNFVKLKEQIESLGLKVKFNLDPHSSITPLTITGIRATYQDPTFIFGNFRPSGYYNKYYPQNDSFLGEEYNALLSATSISEKKIISEKISSHISQNSFVIPLWDLLSVYTFNSKKIHAQTYYMQPGGLRFKIFDRN